MTRRTRLQKRVSGMPTRQEGERVAMPKRKNSNAEIKVYRRREGGRCYDILSMRQ
jgi:hypothetical protein